MTTTYSTTLAAVLTHTTGILLAPIDDAFPLQDFLVGRPLWTHERGSHHPMNDVGPTLLAQFPQLAEAEPPTITTQAEADAWVESVAAHAGLPLMVEVTR